MPKQEAAVAKEDKLHATCEQLRAHIDSGQTGSKVPWPDPAAAPLGADEEAAGTPVAPHVIHAAFEQETGSPFAHAARPGAGHTAVNPPARGKLAVLALLLAAVVALTLWFAWSVP